MATIHFAYDNRDLIFKLMERGNIYLTGKFKQAFKIESEITQMLKMNEKKYERPIRAFVIFNSQECTERCFHNWMTTKNIFGKVKHN